MICSIWMAFLSYFATFSMASTFWFCRPLSSLCHRFLVALVSLVLSILEIRVLYFAVKLPLLHRSRTLFTSNWPKSPTLTYIRQYVDQFTACQVWPGCAWWCRSLWKDTTTVNLPWELTFFWRTHHCLIRPVIWRCWSGWKQDLV